MPHESFSPYVGGGDDELVIPCLDSFDLDYVTIPPSPPDIVLKYHNPQPFILNVSLLHFLSQKAGSHSVQYDSLCGRYFLRDTTVIVCLMSKVSEQQSLPDHFTLAEQEKCFNFYIQRSVSPKSLLT